MLSLLKALPSVSTSLATLPRHATAINLFPSVSSFHTTAINERARQATRIRKRKKALADKKKKEERLRKNPPPLPKKLRLVLRAHGIYGDVKPIRANEENLTFPKDDFYFKWEFCYERMEFEKALERVRMHYHPSLLNRPNDLLQAKVELNMHHKGDKYIDEFSKIVPIIHPFDDKMRAKSLCVFADTEESRQEALEVGAVVSGGLDLINEIVKGRFDISEIDQFVCHEDMLVHMKPLIGILREKVPQKKNGTVGADIKKMVRTFRTGIEVQVKKLTPSIFVAKQPDYGYCQAPIGKLTQDAALLQENLQSLLETLKERKPGASKGGFITRVYLCLDKGPHYAQFSIQHPLIDDKKWSDHLKALNRATTSNS